MWFLALLVGNTKGLPPVGAVYEYKFRIASSFQQVRLHIDSQCSATLSLQGVFQLEDSGIEYQFQSEGGLVFSLGPSTKKLLRRTFTRLGEVEYDPVHDMAFVAVIPPLIGTRQILLRRSSQTGTHKKHKNVRIEDLEDPNVA